MNNTIENSNKKELESALELKNDLETMLDRYCKLVNEVSFSLGKLDQVKIELQKAREVYEKGLFGLVQKNFKLCLFGILFVVAGLIVLCIMKDTSINFLGFVINSCQSKQ
jgi:hypothetical protein